MGSPKHLLLDVNQHPLYIRTLSIIRSALPDTVDICISIRDARQMNEFGSSKDLGIHFVMDPCLPSSIGPAAGLLAAHAYDPHAHWLVIACDYPLITSETLRQLLDEYREPVTCFQNNQGWVEPLLAIWSPVALEAL